MPSLEELIGHSLTQRHLTLSVAESCTGGLVSHRLTNVPGSSDYFLGGIVAYAYDAKEQLLGVQHTTLIQQGAVSEATVREMARGARQALHTDIGVAITGIAGPGGGMPGKPIGLVWVAVAADNFERAERFIWGGDREQNKADSAEAALQMVWDFLESDKQSSKQ